MGTTRIVVVVRLPRNLPRIRYAIGTDAMTLNSAAGRLSFSVVQIVSRR
jgi:hypothetical protein